MEKRTGEQCSLYCFLGLLSKHEVGEKFPRDTPKTYLRRVFRTDLRKIGNIRKVSKMGGDAPSLPTPSLPFANNSFALKVQNQAKSDIKDF